jgi:anti-sigma factor RsiW
VTNEAPCSAVRELLPLFFDGELEAAALDRVVSHSAQCQRCEQEIAVLDRMHVLIRGSVEEAADKLDAGDLWREIESRLPAPKLPWRQRLRLWWESIDGGARIAWPAAAALAVALLAMGLYLRSSDLRNAPQPAAQVAYGGPNALDVPAEIQQIETDFPMVTVMNDDANRATVIWVSDETAPGGQW